MEIAGEIELDTLVVSGAEHPRQLMGLVELTNFTRVAHTVSRHVEVRGLKARCSCRTTRTAGTRRAVRARLARKSFEAGVTGRARLSSLTAITHHTGITLRSLCPARTRR